MLKARTTGAVGGGQRPLCSSERSKRGYSRNGDSLLKSGTACRRPTDYILKSLSVKAAGSLQLEATSTRFAAVLPGYRHAQLAGILQTLRLVAQAAESHLSIGKISVAGEGPA